MVCLIVLLPRGILSIIIEANFRNWNDAQQKSMTNFFHDMKAEVRNQPLSHIFFMQVNFLTGEQLNVGPVGLLIINNWIDELN